MIKYCSLSFDDGPNTGTTIDVLDVLKKHNVPASFFVCGKNVTDETVSVLQRAVSQGCDIENHSKTHQAMTAQSVDEIIDEIEYTDNVVFNAIGKKPTLFRPPYIAYDNRMYENISHTFICGVGCDDWDNAVSVEKRVDVITNSVKDGNIILLHDMMGNDATVEALDLIIPILKEKGFEFVTTKKLFEVKGITPKPHDRIIYTNVLQKEERI